jgi:hypothetical protein
LRHQKPGEGDHKGPGFLVERGEDFLQERFCWLLKASPPHNAPRSYTIYNIGLLVTRNREATLVGAAVAATAKRAACHA